MPITNYNLRVYGLLIRENKVLITHEHRAGMLMTKFPGGGLEKGEGLAEGLIREFKEELSLEIEVAEIFYVNEFLQVSAFNPSDQLISFYFVVHTQHPHLISIDNEKDKLNPGQQIFEWVSFEKLKDHRFTFPVDAIVAGRLASRASGNQPGASGEQ